MEIGVLVEALKPKGSLGLVVAFVSSIEEGFADNRTTTHSSLAS
jgi:hypothetical protein